MMEPVAWRILHVDEEGKRTLADWRLFTLEKDAKDHIHDQPCAFKDTVVVDALGSLSDAEARIAELEAAYENQQRANVYLSETITATAARAEAAEALLKEAGPIIAACREMADDYQSSQNHHPNHVLVAVKSFENMRSGLSNLDASKTGRVPATAEAMLSKLLSYVPEECFEGDTRWELVKCRRAGGAWFGAEDFRAARAIHDKIWGKG